jgi:hypothetical protein
VEGCLNSMHEIRTSHYMGSLQNGAHHGVSDLAWGRM